MQVIISLIRKEFAQFFRDSAYLRMMILMPVIQLIIIPFAADYEVENIQLVLLDQDRSQYSTEMIRKLTSSGYINLIATADSYQEALEYLDADKADVILNFPLNFEMDLVKENKAAVSLSINAVNGQRASIGAQYVLSILRDYNMELRLKWVQFPKFNPLPLIKIEPLYWFNPYLNYQQFMVPGILVLLLTMVGSIMAALNLVKEKELGTIEQINVSPIKKHQFILGKLIPFWILAQVVLTLGLLVAYIVYGIVPVGSYVLIYFFSSIYLFAVLGMGLLISTIANTQQQTMLISFFIMMVFILLSGLYTPIESMPDWAMGITKINPIAYFVKVMRMVVMKGSGFFDILPSALTIGVMAIVLNALAILNYKKNS